MNFALPYLLLFLPVAALLPWLGRYRSISFSSLAGMEARKTWRVRFAFFPLIFGYVLFHVSCWDWCYMGDRYNTSSRF